jgi:hypothetical protein
MNNNGRQAFTPPLISEVKKFIEENNLNVDGNYWYEYYQDRKWLVNGKPIKNWKGLVINWHKTQLDDKADENRIVTPFGETVENGQIDYEETDLHAVYLSLFGKKKGQYLYDRFQKELAAKKASGEWK